MQNDDMSELIDIVTSSKGLILASPVYFYSLPGHAKSFIDRFQPFWEKKYRKKEKILGNKLALGAFISVAGSGGERVFDCIRLPYKYMLDTLSAENYDPMLIRNHDSSPDSMSDSSIRKALEYGREFSIFLQKY